MKKAKILISILLCAVIVLASLFVVRLQSDAQAALPYRIGSPVIPATQLPAGMVLKTFNVPSTETPPTIGFDITPDSMGGWDVHVTTSDFTFSPEHLNGVPIAGEGHVHLYIDNELIIMLGPWYHIDSLTPGTHTIRVGLFNNDHSAYSVDGAYVETQKEIVVPKSNGADSDASMANMNM